MPKPEGLKLGKHGIFGDVNPRDFGQEPPVPEPPPTRPGREVTYNPPPSKGKLKLPVIRADGLRDCLTCPAPCCTILVAEVTKAEAMSGKWQVVQGEDGKYYLDRPYGRCAHLNAQNMCMIYHDRPAVCVNYYCGEDTRIHKWMLKNCE